MASTYQVIQLADIPQPEYEKEPGDADWRPIRIHFGIQAFGANAYLADRGNTVIEEHTETEGSGTRHEELYFVAKGRARFSLDGEEIDAPEGTFVYVPDPDTRRSAVAEADRTAVMCFGGTPGEAFSVSPWERKYDPAANG